MTVILPTQRSAFVVATVGTNNKNDLEFSKAKEIYSEFTLQLQLLELVIW